MQRRLPGCVVAGPYRPSQAVSASTRPRLLLPTARCRPPVLVSPTAFVARPSFLSCRFLSGPARSHLHRERLRLLYGARTKTASPSQIDSSEWPCCALPEPFQMPCSPFRLRSLPGVRRLQRRLLIHRLPRELDLRVG